MRLESSDALRARRRSSSRMPSSSRSASVHRRISHCGCRRSKPRPNSSEGGRHLGAPDPDAVQDARDQDRRPAEPPRGRRRLDQAGRGRRERRPLGDLDLHAAALLEPAHVLVDEVDLEDVAPRLRRRDHSERHEDPLAGLHVAREARAQAVRGVDGAVDVHPVIGRADRGLPVQAPGPHLRALVGDAEQHAAPPRPPASAASRPARCGAVGGRDRATLPLPVRLLRRDERGVEVRGGRDRPGSGQRPPDRRPVGLRRRPRPQGPRSSGR